MFKRENSSIALGVNSNELCLSISKFSIKWSESKKGFQSLFESNFVIINKPNSSKHIITKKTNEMVSIKSSVSTKLMRAFRV